MNASCQRTCGKRRLLLQWRHQGEGLGEGKQSLKLGSGVENIAECCFERATIFEGSSSDRLVLMDRRGAFMVQSPVLTISSSYIKYRKSILWLWDWDQQWLRHARTRRRRGDGSARQRFYAKILVLFSRDSCVWFQVQVTADVWSTCLASFLTFFEWLVLMSIETGYL